MTRRSGMLNGSDGKGPQRLPGPPLHHCTAGAGCGILILARESDVAAGYATAVGQTQELAHSRLVRGRQSARQSEQGLDSRGAAAAWVA